MAILLVCHSVGDTNVIIETTKKLINETKEKIHILAIGNAASTQLKRIQQDKNHPFSEAKNIDIVYLAEKLNIDPKLIEDKPLSQQQLQQVKDLIKEVAITSALLGTPSINSAIAPFQIAEVLTEELNTKNVGIHNDYLFFEEKHSYWEQIRSQKDWTQKCTWLVPLPKAKNIIQQQNSSLKKIEIVGHPSIDAALKQNLDPKTMLDTRQQLEVSEEQSFLFISGSKVTQDDLNLLKELTEYLAQNKNNDLIIRLGIHGGHADLASYIKDMIAAFKELPPELGKQCKIIINDNPGLRKIIDSSSKTAVSIDLLAKTIGLTDEDKTYLQAANISGDQATIAADAVASVDPATLVNTAGLLGKPAYYLNSNKVNYLDRTLTGKNGLTEFFERLRHKAPSSAAPKDGKEEVTSSIATKQELGIPEEETAAIIAKKLTCS